MLYYSLSFCLWTVIIAACKVCSNRCQALQLSPELRGKQCHRNFFLVGGRREGNFSG